MLLPTSFPVNTCIKTSLHVNLFNEYGSKEFMEEDNHTFSRQQQEQIKNMFDFWSELVKLPTVGPFQAFSKDFIFYMQEFFNLGQTLFQLQTDLKEYFSGLREKMNGQPRTPLL